MTSIIVSTVAYVLAAYFLKRYLDDMGIPKTFTRTTVIVVIALAVSYGASFVVDWVVG